MTLRVVVVALAILIPVARSCDLCAIYRAGDARGETSTGLLLIVAEQYIPYRTSQYNGTKVTPPDPSYVDSSITHLVAGYNFTPRFGVNLNVPLTHLSFDRTDLRYSLTAPPVRYTEQGTEFGIGDVAMIGRVTVLQQNEMDRGYAVNVLAGVKFPTGNAGRLQDEVDQARIYQSLLPPGTPHDPLGHSISSVHQSSLALGSGSFDGIFGVTASARWDRWFVNGQAQYYLRTEGEAGFQYGNELIVSGGPGVYLLLDKSYTLSVQVNATFDTTARDQILGQASDQTGMTAWYLGPAFNFTWGSQLNLYAGVDAPISIDNNGYQVVPNYRLNAGVSWRF